MIKCDGHRIQVSISGSETIEFTYAFEHYTVQNLGLSAIYVSIKDPNCTSNAPDVTYIKAGGEANIDGDGVSMRVHFRGSGSIQIVGKHDRLLDFKSALTEGGGGGEGKVYEGVLPIVVNNDENKISVNLATSSVVGVVKPDNTTITINNGVLSAVGGIGENLLINPDFRINQRKGQGTWTHSTVTQFENYITDRWYLQSGIVTVNPDSSLTLNGTIIQILEDPAGENVTASASAGQASYDNSTKTFTLTGNGDVISWAKLERGSEATPFVPPDPCIEFIRCRRFFERRDYPLNSYLPCWSYVNGAVMLVHVPYSTEKRCIPTVTADMSRVRIVRNDPDVHQLYLSNIVRTEYVPTIFSCGMCIFLDGVYSQAFGWIDSFSLDIDAELYPQEV